MSALRAMSVLAVYMNSIFNAVRHPLGQGRGSELEMHPKPRFAAHDVFLEPSGSYISAVDFTVRP